MRSKDVFCCCCCWTEERRKRTRRNKVFGSVEVCDASRDVSAISDRIRHIYILSVLFGATICQSVYLNINRWRLHRVDIVSPTRQYRQYTMYECVLWVSLVGSECGFLFLCVGFDNVVFSRSAVGVAHSLEIWVMFFGKEGIPIIIINQLNCIITIYCRVIVCWMYFVFTLYFNVL